MDDVRELRVENEQLKEQLAAVGSRTSSAGASGAPAAVSGGVLDWETEKQRILAALEADAENDDEDDEPARQQRLKLEEVVRRTDHIIAQKNREIEELQKLLEEKSANVGSMVVGAAALGDILDQDEIIREERENLAQLQQQWRDKLRAAEVEISVERAKIARERTQLEERLQALEKAASTGDGEGAKGEPRDKPARGRWLAQLGLKDKDSP